MHHFGPDTDTDTDPDNDRETVWTLAKRSRRTVVGLGLLVLGALFPSMAARDSSFCCSADFSRGPAGAGRRASYEWSGRESRRKRR